MVSEFYTYLRLGLGHILDLNSYDHILFVVALVAGEGQRLKRLIWLVTAFTVGHSLTLALATLKLVSVNPAWIEFLIPLTIVLTCIINITQKDGEADLKRERMKYSLALIFGLIHGLGFSNYLRAVLGAEEAIAVPLLGFNIGVELGQLLVVVAARAGSRLVTRTLRLTQRQWLLVLSGATAIIALVMMMGRIPF